MAKIRIKILKDKECMEQPELYIFGRSFL